MNKTVLIFTDGKLPHVSMLKASTFYKGQGYEVVLDSIDKPSLQEAEIVLCSIIFPQSKQKAEKLRAIYPHIQYGGSGWDDYVSDPPIISRLPEEIEACKPDYDLYTVDYIYPRIKGIMTRETRKEKAQMIVDAGIGFSSRGCIRDCSFCGVRKKEGPFRQDMDIKDIINPRSNILYLLDNNLTADPYCLEKLKEIKERGLVVNISSGIDVRLLTPEKAKALSEIKLVKGKIHYAWDLLPEEEPVMRGINILSRYLKKWRHMCYMLVGFNTSFEEDMYRFKKLRELRVDPYVMIYNDIPDIKLHHFERWVNGRYYGKYTWESYLPWVKAQMENDGLLFNCI